MLGSFVKSSINNNNGDRINSTELSYRNQYDETAEIEGMSFQPHYQSLQEPDIRSTPVATSASLYIKSLLVSLMNSVLCPEANNDRARKTLMEYCVRILSSRIGSSSSISQDYLNIADQIRKWVSKNFSTPNEVDLAIRISQLLNLLPKSAGKHGIGNLNGHLFFLWSLRSSDHGVNKEKSLAMSDSRTSSRGYSNWSASVSEPPSFFLEDLTTTTSTKRVMDTPTELKISPENFFENDQRTRVRDSGLQVSRPVSEVKDLEQAREKNSNSENLEGYKSHFDHFIKIKNECGFTISETVLVKDALFVLQGINGTFLHFDIPQSKSSEFDPNLKCKINFTGHSKISPPKRAVLIRLAECGFIYKRICAFLSESSRGKTLGLYKQCFCFAIQEEILQYDKFIACMEGHLVSGDGQASATPGMTLIRLHAWIQDQMKKLRFIFHLIQSTLNSKGGELLTILDHFSNHGDPILRKFMEPLMAASCKPFYVMLDQWMHHGILEDPFDEFFIHTRNNDKVSDQERESTTLVGDFKSFKLSERRIPSFMPRELAEKIFRAGKSLNFLRSALKDNLWMNQFEISLDDMEKPESGYLGKSNFDQVIKRVTKEYSVISSRVCKLVFDQHKLVSHLDAMKRYLLLGQGDFILNLLDLLAPCLSQPASSIYRHNLTGILETAIRSSNAQFDPEEILKRVDVRLLESFPSDRGWDVFCLDYRLMDSPLKAIIDSQSSKIYLRLFQYLWKIKRVSHQLIHSNWKTLFQRSSLLRDINSPIEGRKGGGLNHRYCRFAELVHFLNQLQYFMVFEVLECSWKELMDNLSAGQEENDLDSVYEFHQKYLQCLMDRSLLNEKDIYGNLMGLLEEILKFSDLSLKNDQLGINNPGPEDDQLAIIQWTKVSGALSKFLFSLQSSNNINARLLSFRLDFNQYYTR